MWQALPEGVSRMSRGLLDDNGGGGCGVVTHILGELECVACFACAATGCGGVLLCLFCIADCAGCVIHVIECHPTPCRAGADDADSSAPCGGPPLL